MNIEKTIKFHKRQVDSNGYSYAFIINDVIVWVDAYRKDDEIITEWNKYIFHDDSKYDQKVKEIQKDDDYYDLVDSYIVSDLDN